MAQRNYLVVVDLGFGRMVTSTNNTPTRRGVDGIQHRPRSHLRIRRSILWRLCLLVIVILVGGFYALVYRFLLYDAHIANTSAPTTSHFVPTTKNISSWMIDPSEPVAVIAHAISLIKCSKGSSVTGFLDAAAILRHSIHKNSIHYSSSFPSSLQHNNSTIQQQQQQQHPTSTADKATTVSSSSSSSRYSYQMYAIVHTSCAEHSTLLSQLGYTILVKDHPVKKEDIRGEWLRNHIESENCCGSAEFIKLYGKCRLNVRE